MPDAHTEASTAHTYTDIATRTDNGVFVITLNRPDKLNAWRAEMDRDVRAAMRIAAADDSVRVIVLTGAGKGFCAGADMGLLQTIQKSSLGEAGGGGSPRSGETEGAGRVFAAGGDAKAGRSVVNAHEPWDPKANPNFQKQYSWFPAVPKPIIAAINGAAAGLGLIISLYCDIRFASDAAKFTTAFSRRGLVAEHGISWLLPRITGFAHAADLLYSARVITAQEALTMGLVSRVLPAATFEQDVMAYARMLATEVSPRSLREMKREIWNAQFQSLGEAIDAANADMPPSFQSEDFKEGLAHFLEKRPPRFTGR